MRLPKLTGSVFAPSVKLSRRRRALNLVRNVWVLRRELWALIRKKPTPEPEGIAVVCLACRHDLTKPCKRGRARHVIQWPEAMDGVGGFATGQLVEVRRQKPRGGSFDKDDALRPVMKRGKPVFLR